MKSQTSLAARNCHLQEWSKMVHSCNNRPIGISVDEWCRENSITTANYYYRKTQVRKTCLDSLSDEAVNQEVVSGGCGRFLGPKLSNSKTTSILHRTQTP